MAAKVVVFFALPPPSPDLFIEEVIESFSTRLIWWPLKG
jgi:hypothetical protein